MRGAGGEMNPKGQHFVRTIKNSSNHLLNIINDILDVAALKVGSRVLVQQEGASINTPTLPTLATCPHAPPPRQIRLPQVTSCPPFPAPCTTNTLHGVPVCCLTHVPQEGKLTIKHEVCSLPKAVDHVVDIVAPLAKKDVAIERAVDPRTPLIIADFSRVIQVRSVGRALW